jgi:hypothetical protein
VLVVSEIALKKQAHSFIDLLQYNQIMVVNELLSLLVDDNTPLIYETDLTEEEIEIIANSSRDFEQDPESFTSLSELR